MEKVFSSCKNKEEKQELRDTILQFLYNEMIRQRKELKDIQQNLAEIKQDVGLIQEESGKLRDNIEYVSEMADYLVSLD